MNRARRIAHRIAHFLGQTFPGQIVLGSYPGDRRTVGGLRCGVCGRITHAIWIEGGQYVDEPESIHWDVDGLQVGPAPPKRRARDG